MTRHALVIGAAWILAACHSLAPSQRVDIDRYGPTCAQNTPAMSANVDGSGPLIVVVGGVITGSIGMQQVARRLAPHRRVILLQNVNVEIALARLPLQEPYSVGVERCALTVALNRLGITGRVDVVGYSYGGLIALDFTLLHPERVRSLTLVEPPAQWILEPDELSAVDQSRFNQAALKIKHRLPSEAEAAALVCVIFGCSPGDELHQARRLPLWPTVLRNRSALSGAFAVAEHRPASSLLEHLRAPVLYVSGVGSSPFHSRINSNFRRAVPAARYIELPGGHAVPVISAQLLGAAILDFTAQPLPAE